MCQICMNMTRYKYDQSACLFKESAIIEKPENLFFQARHMLEMFQGAGDF